MPSISIFAFLSGAENECAYVAIQEESGSTKVVGFVAGALNSALYFRNLARRNLFQICFILMVRCLLHPSIIPRVVKTSLYRMSKSQETREGAELISIAVDPSWQGKGIGERLQAAFLAEMKRRGAKSVSLTTDRDDNEAVNAFYRRTCWSMKYEFVTPAGRAMNLYYKELDKA